MIGEIHDGPAAEIMQDLYKEIEHLMDAPFGSLSSKEHRIETSMIDSSGLEIDKVHDRIIGTLTKGTDVLPYTDPAPQNIDNENRFSQSRPILIESDSDEIEEELLTPNQQQYSFLTCYKCARIIPFDPVASSNNRLSIPTAGGDGLEEAANICSECAVAKKKRSRSRSFTGGGNVFSAVADKVKRSLSGNQGQYRTANNSSATTLLSPIAIPSISRRKSMPTISSAFQQSARTLEPPPSPTPSRPSSRASSFIEDFKQLLSPLSRRSSRNSMLQDDVNSNSQTLPDNSTPTRKPSHSSLLDAFNIHKSKHKSNSPSYERRLIRPSDDQLDNSDNMELSNLQSEEHFQDFDLDKCVHIPLRRKQVKQIASRQDRIDLYNNAYLDCMQSETDLIPWILNQTQKGPPDAWFGYTPPPKEPKKILGIFKRKSSTSKNNRAQQQIQLGEDLLTRTTPLLQRHLSNSSFSHLSTSPAAQSYMSFQQDTSNNHVTPSGLTDDDEPAYYFQGMTEPEEYTTESNESTGVMATSPSVQPVSILKKSKSSNRELFIASEELNNFSYEEEPSMDYLDAELIYNGLQAAYDTESYQQTLSRRRSSSSNCSRRRKSSAATVTDVNNSRYMIQSHPHEKNFKSRYIDDYNEHRQSEELYDNSMHADMDEDYHGDRYLFREHSIHEPKEQPRRNTSRSSSRKASISRLQQQPEYDPYEEGVSYSESRSTPSSYYMEEWEYNLDGLCEMFPRFDREYLNDFLESAHGDFVTAKRMILDMVMKSTGP